MKKEGVKKTQYIACKFRIKLFDYKGIVRDIMISSRSTLSELAEAILLAFEFQIDHAYGFYSNLKGDIYDSTEIYELFFDMGEADDECIKSVKKTHLDTVFSVGKQMTFYFDYGDDWKFLVECVGFFDRKTKMKYPMLVFSMGTAPKQYED